MTRSKLFLGKANYEFGSRYILLHLDSGICMNFSNPAGLGNYLFESYGRNFHRRISYNFPEENEMARVQSLRERDNLEELILTTLGTEEAKLIDDAVDKIGY